MKMAYSWWVTFHWKCVSIFWFKYQLHISLIFSAPNFTWIQRSTFWQLYYKNQNISFLFTKCYWSECWKWMLKSAWLPSLLSKKCLTQTQDWDSQSWRMANFWQKMLLESTLKAHLIYLLSWCRAKVSVTFLSTGNVNITNPSNRNLTSSLHKICLCFIISTYSSQYLTWISLAAF